MSDMHFYVTVQALDQVEAKVLDYVQGFFGGELPTDLRWEATYRDIPHPMVGQPSRGWEASITVTFSEGP